MDDTATILKACIVSHKGGIPKEELDNEFFKFTGMYIPYLSLGYFSLYEYLGTIKDMIKVRNKDGELVYKVESGKAAHIADMVANQKDSFSGTRSTRINSRDSNKEVMRNNKWKRKAVDDSQTSQRVEKRRKKDAKRNHGNSPLKMSNYGHWYEEEYHHSVKIMEKPQKMDVIYEPIVSGKLLIGDDFFLQLAIRNIGTTIWRKQPNTALHSGLCASGQTIKECTRSLSKVQVVANKVVIMLGAEDIYRGHSSKKMIEDMEDLLDYLEAQFALSRSAITLCTIPPLANLAMNCHRQQLSTLYRFNSWIREQTNVSFHNDDWDSGSRYNLIEFFYNNTNAQIATAYDYFQMDARMVSGSSHPYVLWNLRGRRLAMTLLRGGSCSPRS